MSKEIISIKVTKKVPKNWKGISDESRKNFELKRTSKCVEKYLKASFINNKVLDAIVVQEELFNQFHIGTVEKFIKMAKEKNHYIIAKKTENKGMLKYIDAIIYENEFDLKFANKYEKPIYIEKYGIGTVLSVDDLDMKDGIQIYMAKIIKTQQKLEHLEDGLVEKIKKIKSSYKNVW